MKNLRTLCAALAASTLLVAALSPVALAQGGAQGAPGQAGYQVGDRLAGPAAAAQGAFREITWDDLIPKDWDAMAALKGINVARLRDGDPKA